METIQTNNFDDNFAGYSRSSLSRELLPVSKHKLEILYSVDKFSTTIIIAETGSGKTTQIPQFLLEAGYAMNSRRIAVSLPRRMAAIAVATRVAHELDCHLGKEVGYHVRFDDKTCEQTLLVFLTDGCLIREMLSDPLLSRYSVIMLDDVHERTSNSDLLMGLLKKIRNKRPELKLIVSSATATAVQIERFFNNAAKGFESNTLYIEGRVYPVDIYYRQNPCANYIAESARLAWEIHLKKPDGDILIFLTGQEEIEVAIELLSLKYEEEIKRNKGNNLKKLVLLPLFGGLPIESQMAVFDEPGKGTRRIIVGTNLAESSVTIPNIVYVIDSCLVKMKVYDQNKDYESLVVMPVSQSSANQRAGRAGRVASGECYRLLSKQCFENLYPSTAPEILRCRLDPLLLQLKSLGVSNLTKFELPDSPSENSMIRALETLFSLNIIDMKGELTEAIGKKISDIALETRLAVLLLNSFKEEFACSEEILILVAFLSLGPIFYSTLAPSQVIKIKKRFGAKEGDLITIMNFYLRYQHIGNRNEKKKFLSENNLNESVFLSAQKIIAQLKKDLSSKGFKFSSADDDVEAILRCITSAFFANAAQREPQGNYKTLRSGETVYLHPSSILNTIYPQWVIYHEIVRSNKFYMRECIEIDYKWLVELAPHFYQDNKASTLEEKHKQEVIKLMNEENISKNKNENDGFAWGVKEKDLEKFSMGEKPRFLRIMEGMDNKGKKAEKEEKANQIKPGKSNREMLSFDYEDL